MLIQAVNFTGYRLTRITLGPFPERLISPNPGLKVFSVSILYLPLYWLEYHFVLSLLYIGSEGLTVFCKLELHVPKQQSLV